MKSGSQICCIRPAVPVGSRALLDHAGAAFAIDGLKIGRQLRRHLGVRAIRNRQLLEQRVEREVFLFQKGDMLFEEHAEMMTRSLGRRLLVKAVQALSPKFPAADRRGAKNRPGTMLQMIVP